MIFFILTVFSNVSLYVLYKLSEKLGCEPIKIALIQFASATFTSLIYIYLMEGFHFNIYTLLIGIVGGMATYGAIHTFLILIKLGSFGLSTVITNLSISIPILVSIIIYRENPGVYTYCAQAVVKNMIDNKYGKIINMASISGFSPFLNSSHYAMTKAGLAMMTKNMALELGKCNIMVNSLVPGIIKTEIVPGYDDEELMQRMKSLIPLDRIGYPEDMVGAAIFLASPLSDYISGIDILVDGGFCLFKDKNPEKK